MPFGVRVIHLPKGGKKGKRRELPAQRARKQPRILLKLPNLSLWYKNPFVKRFFLNREMGVKPGNAINVNTISSRAPLTTSFFAFIFDFGMA